MQVSPDPLLYDAFSPFGRIAFLSFDRQEEAGLVCYRTEAEAERALALNGAELAAHRIGVTSFDPHRHPRLAALLRERSAPSSSVPQPASQASAVSHAATDCPRPPLDESWHESDDQVEESLDGDDGGHEEEVEEADEGQGRSRKGKEKEDGVEVRSEAGGSVTGGPDMGLEFENARLLRKGKPILFNFRDIGFATFHDTRSGVRLRPGVIYRSACWSRAPVSRQDVVAILKFWQEACDIRTLLDLRSKGEKLEDHHDQLAEEFYKTVSELDLYHYLPNETSGGPGKTRSFTCPRYRRFPVDLVTRRLTYRGLMMSAPKRVYLKMMACSLRGRPRAQDTGGLVPSPSSLSLADLPSKSPHDASPQEKKGSYRRRALAALSASAPDLRRQYPPASMPPPSTPRGVASPHPNDERPDLYDVDLEEELIDASLGINAITASQVFVSEVFNPLGLIGFTRLLLEHSGRELGQALRLLIDKRNHPILIHCASGKDRTGLVVALVLSVCGVSRETIIENYAESEVYLRFVMGDIIKENRSKGLGEHFDGTPREVMRDTLAFIDQRWGSVPAFLNSACLFSFVEQAYLRKLLVDT